MSIFDSFGSNSSNRSSNSEPLNSGIGNIKDDELESNRYEIDDDELLRDDEDEDYETDESEEEDGLDFDPNFEFVIQYNLEAVAVPAAAYSATSILKAIKDNSDELGLPSDITKLKARIGGQYLSDADLNLPPQAGLSIIVSFKHSDKG